MSLNSRILEKTAEIQRLLDEINAELVQGEFKTPTVTTTETPTPPKYTTSAELPPVEYSAPDKTELQKDGIDFNLVDYLTFGNIIKGKGRLERTLWGEYDKILYANGYKYSQPDQAWLFQPRDKKPKQDQPKKAAAPTSKASKVTRISDITTQKSVTIEGDILDDPTYKDFNRKDGSVGSVASFRVSDGSGQARVSLWDDKAMYAMNFVSGDRVRLTSLMVKEPYEGVTQLSGGKFTEITKL